jgi:hypothetical protein
MSTFKSHRGFLDFENSVARELRYIRNPDQEEFLEAVLETSQGRRENVAAGACFWRAQIGHNWRDVKVVGETESEPCPFDRERMKPRPYRASEGRANPKGIPVLYMATNQRTAIVEVRPWVGLHVSVAMLKTLRPLSIVNCTTEDTGLKLFLSEPSPKQRELAVWQDIDRWFSLPVNSSDSLADYVPTQIIAELFKAHGMDGIYYRSSLGPGHNVVIFDLAAADVVDCGLVQIKEVKFNYFDFDA